MDSATPLKLNVEKGWGETSIANHRLCHTVLNGLKLNVAKKWIKDHAGGTQSSDNAHSIHRASGSPGGFKS
jgi:hypothetical protein